MVESTESNNPPSPETRYNRYLREVQYARADNLNARLGLHAKYSTAPVGWFDWLHQQFSWSGVRDALDVGCGTGLLWSTLPHSLPNLRLTLSDISRSMIEQSRDAADQRVGEVRAVEASVMSLPFDDSSFDVVVANHMLYHATDPERAVKEIRRVLRSGGLLVASTVGPSHLRELVDIARTVFPVPERRNLGTIFGPTSGLALLKPRFESVEWRVYEDYLRCSDVGDVRAYITSVPPGSHATPEQLGSLSEEIQRRMDHGGGVLNVVKESGVFLARCAV